MVNVLSKDEIRFYKLYAAWVQKLEDRKDITLFDYIKQSGDKYDEKKIVEKLYKSDKDKNSFYRLKNRLINDITASIVLQHFSDDDILLIHQLLSVVKLFADKTQYEVAFNFLNKAEQKALKIENYELLDIIYGEFIRLSQDAVWKNPEDFILKRKENMERLRSLRQIDDVLAVVTYRLKLSQNISKGDDHVLDVLSKTIEEFSSNKDIKESPTLRFKIYTAVCQILIQKHDYISLEKYLLKTYSEFKNENLFSKTNHETKLQMLTYLINALSKNDKIKEALHYIDLLKLSMDEYDKLLFNKYQPFYHSTLVHNYVKFDLDKAIDLLEELKINKQIRNASSFYDMFIFLNLAIVWWRKDDYKKAIKNLVQLYKHDSYKNANEQLQFKISMFELILRYELNDFDFLEHRIQQIEKDFQKILKESALELELLQIIKAMILSTSFRSDKKLRARIDKFILLTANRKQGDDDIIHYGNWLQKKL